MKYFLPLFFFLVSSPSFGQYRGRVFIDSNQNETIDAEERGVANVRVSDGFHVVSTDQDGAFELSGFEKTKFLFVTVPAGYRLSNKHYLKVEDQERSYDFGLISDTSTAGKEISILQITDTETFIYGDWIANVRNFARAQHAALIVHTGDICYEKGLSFHATQVNAALLQKPIYYAIGNHDLVKGAYGEEMFEELYGPTYYSFDAGPAHFVITPMPHGDVKPGYTLDQVIGWLRNDLANTDPNKPVFLFNHDLPVYGDDFILKGEKDSIYLNRYNLKAWVYGHWHNNFVKRFEKSGIYAISTGAPNKGGIDNSAGQFLSIDIDEQGIKKIQARYTNLKEHVVITSPNRSNMNLLTKGRLQISANSYDSEWKIKEVKALVYDEQNHCVGMEKLMPATDWNWRGTMQADRSWLGKAYTIQMEVYYENGRSTIRKQAFQLAADPMSVDSMRLAWNTNVGGSIWKAAPLFAENKVFVGTIDDAGNKQCGIVALDARTGEQLWRYQTRNSIKNALSYDDGILLATDMEGTVYALQATNGELLWKKELGMDNLPGYVTGGVTKDGIYYTGFGKYLQALHVASGKTLWKNEAWSNGEGTPSRMTIAGEVLISGSNWNSLFGHDRTTGKLLWKRNDDGLRFRSGTATYQDGKLYVTGLNALFVLDPKTGETINKVNTTMEFKVMAAPLLSDDLIIVPTSDQGVVAYDKNTLTQKWQMATREALVYSAPYTSPDLAKPVRTVESSLVAKGDSLLFGASDGYIYVLNKRDGTVVNKLNIGAPIFSEAAMVQHTCYFADFGGTVYGFSFMPTEKEK